MDPRLVALGNKPKPYIIAHRGNLVVCPENTLAAFQQALVEGADILETDLQITADRIFVCIHDETVDRTTDGSGPVAQLTLDQIKALSASHGRREFHAERIPTLAELGELIPADILLALELKSDDFLNDVICSQLIDELDQIGVRDQTMVLSFSQERLQAVRSVAPDMPIGSITLSNPFPPTDTNLVGPLWPLLLANPFYVATAHRRGQLVCPLDPKPDSRLWLYRWMKCDAVLSNNPGATSRALGRSR